MMSTSSVTLEEGQGQQPWSAGLPDGYPKIAQIMGLNPEMATFRRFGALSAQILLHKQCELIQLETRYRASEARNNQSPNWPQNVLCTNAGFLEHPDVAEDEQVKILREIESKLKEYGDLLQLHHTLANMPEPSKSDIAFIRDSMAPFDGGEGILPLTGADQLVWGQHCDENGQPVREAPDLVALHGRREIDPFSAWVTGSGLQRWFASGFDRGRKPSEKHGIVGYSEKALLRLTSWVTTMIASALPVVSIIILQFVKSMRTRLAVIAVFNVLVSLALLIFSDAKRSEIFAVAAGFAAVQVVFVGTSGANNGEC